MVARPSAPMLSHMLEGLAILEGLFGRIFFSYQSQTLLAWRWRDGRVWVSGSCKRDSGTPEAGLSRARCRHTISGCRLGSHGAYGAFRPLRPRWTGDKTNGLFLLGKVWHTNR